MQAIKDFIDNISPMSESDWQLFSSKLEKRFLKKRTLVLKLGEVENHLSFISKGMVRFYIPNEDNEVTFGFLFENEFVTAYDSFLTRSPSNYEIETLVDTELWSISYQDLESIYSKTQNGNLIGRKMAERMFLIKSARELALLSKTAEQRYLDLFAQRPKLIKHIPLKYIASYIGVTPQALSRIRRRIT